MKTSTRDRRALAQALRLIRSYRARRPRRILLEEAEIELWGVHRREQADLLVQARGLRCAPNRCTPNRGAHNRGSQNRGSQWADAPNPVAARSAWRARLRAWRSRAAECAEVCALDGYPFAGELAACLARPARLWPSDERLAAEARRLGALAP